MTGEIGWETLVGWEDLDLSQMWRFEFGPKVQSVNEDLNLPEDKNSMAARAIIALAAVRKKCGNKLEESSFDSKLSNAGVRRRRYRLTSVVMF